MPDDLPPTAPHREAPIPQVRGTRDWLPGAYAAIASLERTLMDRFVAAGFQAIRTPILEVTELHERKSGAAIVSKLFEVADGPARLCLRPELTASVVRAFIDAEPAPEIPWRVCSSGPVFRFERDPGPTRSREFTQAGVELLGAPGPEADAEVIALAVDSARAAGVADPRIRVGHTGLIVELLDRSGLPSAAVSSLIEHLSDAASEGRGVRALESAFDRLSGWLQGEAEREAKAVLPAIDQADDPGVDRLFRHLVPRVTGRRTGREIIGRLRTKWALGHSLGEALDRVRDRVHSLADLRGPAVEVLQRLELGFSSIAPGTIRGFLEMLRLLEGRGIPPERVELDLGFGHGIGFYSQMIFELAAPTPSGPVAICHGGRYDGLARVLGSDRDPHGVGFAFGVERLYHALEALPR
ncbi:ATP phosphoribosyltransferase regulatory subunit [Tautonia sociabilis]|uniref:Histidine--tRNA ligase n=1 Tax=Tautonia sociabilis TaxID=2080755 RepID=A0A432MK70_9BACT|nr:HisS family protein [Tautonia sociabilis]RUL87639.1 histidine--tRNA ligase family protein [Tautonia sociabilis]